MKSISRIIGVNIKYNFIFEKVERFGNVQSPHFYFTFKTNDYSVISVQGITAKLPLDNSFTFSIHCISL